ncbi:MAG: ATP-binding cassette domain-containing protein [Pricia sp.]|nr:ATP-binding cassette domain-containing protein [Pricia sp.]
MKIKFTNVTFSYDKAKAPVIQNFSLEVKEGDIIGIKGPSGSGKTTIFRLLLGFEIPDSGNITFNGEKLGAEQLKLLRKETTWLPQDLDLGEGNLKEVFYYPFSFQTNKNQKPTEEKVLSTFEALGLSKNTWDETFKNLSTGQRQRVGLALCHLLNKNILILDEPTSALDEASKEKVKKLLLSKNRMIISTSHDPWWLERCSKIIELKIH